MTLLETAIKWKSNGISTIPIQFRDKKPISRLLPDGKWESYKSTLPTDTELTRWFSSSLRNIGLVVGWNHLLVVDFDNLDSYKKWLLWCARKGGIAEEVSSRSYLVYTSRGVHVYVYTSNTELNRKLPGIDIKAQGGYVLIPPSIHPSGFVYSSPNEKAPIMRINELSDIIPGELLLDETNNTEYQNVALGNVLKSVSRSRVDDPWASATDVPDPSIDLIQQIRSRHTILDYFPDAKPRRTSRDGRWLIARCPFHDDKNPSFWIDTVRGLCGCFGGCTPKALDVINLHARLHGVSLKEAVRDLVKNWG